MNVTFVCPRCEQPARVEFESTSAGLVCPHCAVTIGILDGAIRQGRVERCLVCPSADLYVRKDFPQRLGVGIVIAGFALSCFTWYHHQVLLTFGVLFATAGIDLMLYLLMGNALSCYRCGAQYRGVTGLEAHGSFDLETHERHRQYSARLGKSAWQPELLEPAPPKPPR